MKKGLGVCVFCRLLMSREVVALTAVVKWRAAKMWYMFRYCGTQKIFSLIAKMQNLVPLCLLSQLTLLNPAHQKLTSSKRGQEVKHGYCKPAASKSSLLMTLTSPRPRFPFIATCLLRDFSKAPEPDFCVYL